MTTWWMKKGGNEAQERKKVASISFYTEESISCMNCLHTYYMHGRNHAYNLWRPDVECIKTNIYQ